MQSSEQMLGLVKAIFNNTNVIGKVYNILFDIFNDTEKDKINEQLAMVCSLIIRSFEHNPIKSYEILSGFIQFKKSKSCKKMKPLIDHLLIEAIDELISLKGWTILRECINTLRNNVIDIQHEPVFMHILSRIILQLDEDASADDPTTVSELCCYLPRERSFTWGWFSYYIARAFYLGLGENANSAKNSKAMRKYLMYYRKMITTLRRNVYKVDPERYNQYYISPIASTSTSASANTMMSHSTLALDDVLIDYFTGLSSSPEYKWAKGLCPSAKQAPAKQAPAPESAPESAPAASEKDKQLHQDSGQNTPIEDLIVVSSAAEIVAFQENAIKKESIEPEPQGWFSWFKWS